MLQVSPDDLRSRARPVSASTAGPTRRVALVMVGIALLMMIAGGVWFALHQHEGRTAVARVALGRPVKTPPLPAKLQEGFMQLDPQKAEEINNTIAVSTAPIEVARPFLLPAVASNVAGQQSAVDCLTAAIYYEAASESLQGQRAVAQVVLNRVRHPAFPKSVCGVVYEGSERRTGCQFSFTCDGSLARKPSTFGWTRARMIAQAALAGVVEPSVGTATHYHTNYVVPYWAWSLDKMTTVGAHIFYRWKGFWGKRAAFNGAYAGEPAGQTAIVPLAYDTAGFTEDSLKIAAVPTSPRPLADEMGRPAASHGPVSARSFEPTADKESGTLLADEKAGTLIAGSTPGR